MTLRYHDKLTSILPLFLLIFHFCVDVRLLAQGPSLTTFAKLGNDSDASITSLTNQGGTVTYSVDTDGRADIGIQSGFSQAAALANVGDTLVYSYTLESIDNNTDAPICFRSGFDFGSSACLHFITGYGTATDARFAANTNGNPFSRGTVVGDVYWDFLSQPELQFNESTTPNAKINVTMTLTLMEITGGTYSFRMVATYQSNDGSGVVYTNRAEHIFTGVSSNTVTGVYHLTNTPSLQINGDTWSLSQAHLGDFSSVSFGSLDSSFPVYDDLYDDVKVGDTVANGANNNFKEGAEVLNAAYAYLHPDSPYLDDSAYLARLKTLLDARFSSWAQNPTSIDIAGSFQAAYAYMLLKKHKPSDITSQEKTSWENAITTFCDQQLTHTKIYDDHILADLWLNGDIRMALAIYFGGIALDRTDYILKAKDAIDLLMSRAFIEDGGTLYVGFNNEVPTYHDVSIMSFMWWWYLTGSPEVKQALDKTLPYVPLSVEPEGFQEQSTAISYKHSYNGIRGTDSALARAYLYQDGLNYFFGQAAENSYDREYSLLHGLLYAINGQTPSVVTPPTNFILYDRAIQGPRGRWPNWAFVATGRDPQKPGPGQEDQGYQGRNGGKNTFIGAMTLGPFANKTALKSALDGICLEVKVKQGTSNDWARSAFDGVYRFLSQDEETSTITREKFATLASSYNVSARLNGAAVANWQAPINWRGQQVWVMTADRVIGIAQVTNTQPESVYGLAMRVILTGGRKPILGAYHNLTANTFGGYDFGDLSFKIHQDNFGGSHTSQRIGMQKSPGDDYGLLFRLHDAQDNQNDTVINFSNGTKRWAVVEFIRKNQGFVTSSNNVLAGNPNFLVLEFVEPNRKFRVIKNLTGATRRYTGNFWSLTINTSSLHKSWEESGATNLPGQPVAIDVDIPAYEHVVVVSSLDQDDHTGSINYFEDVF